jgi:stage V sporulation protein SpoVS
VDLTAAAIAAALNKNDYTEAESVGTKRLNLTVRPRGSSRTYEVQVTIDNVREI